jgi:hypothetical protein
MGTKPSQNMFGFVPEFCPVQVIEKSCPMKSGQKRPF